MIQKRRPNQEVNVGSHTFIFKCLRFGPSLKHNPGVFNLKWGQLHFQKSQFSRIENSEVVWTPVAKVMRFKTEKCKRCLRKPSFGTFIFKSEQ